MMQQSLFSKNTIKNINVYHAASQTESLGETGFNVKFTPTQKEAIKSIMKEHGLKASTFIREAMDLYIELFPLRSKLLRHKDMLRVLVENLR